MIIEEHLERPVSPIPPDSAAIELEIDKQVSEALEPRLDRPSQPVDQFSALLMQDTLNAKTGSTEFKGAIPKNMSSNEAIVLQSNFHKLRAL